MQHLLSGILVLSSQLAPTRGTSCVQFSTENTHHSSNKKTVLTKTAGRVDVTIQRKTVGHFSLFVCCWAVMADFPMVSLSLSSYTARPKSKSRPRSRMGNRAATSQGKLNLVESEVLSHLFSFLDAAALSRAECVCCAWLRTARGDGGCLWRWLYIVEPSRSYPL